LLALEALVVTKYFAFAAGLLQDDFTRFAITDLDCIDQALPHVAAEHEAVHQHPEGLAEINIEKRLGCRELEDLAVLIEAIEALRPQHEQMVAELLRIAGSLDWKKRVPARAFGLLEEFIGNLIDAIAHDTNPAVRAIGAADARPKQAEEVVELGCSCYGRTGIARCVLLFDRDRRSDAEDFIDVGLLHALEKLARVGRQRFDVASLAFRINRVEDKRRLAGPGHSRDDGEEVVRDVDGDVLEIVDPRSADRQGIFHYY
jgi:hypothetical protein